ncbi:unnamed protein product [Strongylus vulgaris]|uniref:Uncharacterized protein n=1 Tax=Strongylus vulgaris TaxID=40348 RepID=A0A3P7ISE6_STRVU|nr:unnamed protein product [Strongylus vulgaris]
MSNPDGVCGYTERVSTTRFVYISVSGLVAVFGVFSNILLFVLFHTTPSRPPSHFPAFLALLDALLCFCFIIIFVVDVNMMYLELPVESSDGPPYTWVQDHFSTKEEGRKLIVTFLVFIGRNSVKK